jgi:hypothetical protein
MEQDRLRFLTHPSKHHRYADVAQALGLAGSVHAWLLRWAMGT